MARHWRKLALVALTAGALGLTCVAGFDAEAQSKTAKKAKAKPAESEQPAEGEEAGTPKQTKKVKQDPAQAQKSIEAAAKLLEAGKADQAAQALTTVLAGGNLPPAIMAKALFYRGMAYRQQKLPAQAIADLTSALWLKGGLGESDRADALRQRSSAYQEAGLSEGGEPAAPAMPSTARAQTRTASAGESWTTATIGPAAPPSPSSQAPTPQDAGAAPKQSGGGWSLGNPFAALFGSSSSAAASAPPQAAAPAPQTTASIEPPRPAAEPSAPRQSTSAWSRNTEVHGSPSPIATSAIPAKPEGKFRIQVGMVRTQDEAQAIAAKVKREYSAAVAAREPQIDEAAVGNMGSFFRVRVGPYATQQEGQAACAKLKGSGLDCLVVIQ